MRLYMLAFTVITVMSPAPSSAQLVRLRVVDLETAAPVTNASVELARGGGAPLAIVASGPDGSAVLRGIAPGAYTVVVSTLGYETVRIDRVEVGESEVDLGDVALRSRALILNPVVVTASRTTEKALDAPASVHTVSEQEIHERTAFTVVDHVRDVPGVDVVNSGIARPVVAIRGFQTVYSTDLMVLTDNRWSSMPSLRFNAFNLLPATDEDIERVEVVLGPGSALYGPNTTTGVLHVITKSPLDHPGTSASLTYGERSLFQGSVRHADRVGSSFGYKISGGYFRGREWSFEDPVEVSNRAAALSAGADASTLLIGKRDFDVERYSVDGRVDFRLAEGSALVLSGARSELLSTIEMSSAGASQTKGWSNSYVQARYGAGEFFAQSYVNWADAGESYSLRSGSRLVDNSIVAVAQLQNGSDIGEGTKLVYGADLIRTVPRTGGTIHGANEGSDETLEVGAYVQAQYALSPEIDVVAAARVDRHDYLSTSVFSPRAAVVYAPAENQNLRLTYNRAFRMPSSVVLFLDQLSSPTLGGLPFGIRLAGMRREGYSFRRDCGGLCMRSPFTPGGSGGAEQFVPLDATPYWSAAVQIVSAVDASAGASLSAMAAPSSTEVGSVMQLLDAVTGRYGVVQDVSDVDGPRPPIQNTIELGYKGLLGDRLFVGADLYYTRTKDRISPPFFLTPNVFMERQSLETYFAAESARLGLGLSSAEIAQLATIVAGIPLGTVAAEGTPGGGADVVLTFENFGEIDYWGADLALRLLLSDAIELFGTYSFASENVFPDVDGFDVHLNAPRNKASLGMEFSDARRGLGAEAGVRVVQAFPYWSGAYAGPVDGYALVDLRLSYAPTFAPGTTLTLSGNNVFDDRHREAAGAPLLGRMVSLRVRRTF